MSNLVLKVTTYLNQLEAQIDERSRLINILKLTPSSNDNFELISQLSRIIKHFNYLQDDEHPKLKSLVMEYNKLLDLLSDDSTINIDEYKFTLKPTIKAVRFKDDDEDDLRNELMGTTKFKPYRDEPNEGVGNDDGDSVDELNSLNNHQLFAQHQQQLVQQDENLDILHDSVKLQKTMGLNINDEIDLHLIMLNDLERGVDASHDRLLSTNNKLMEFRRKVQENGSLITIIVLTVILILLLVVLN